MRDFSVLDSLDESVQIIDADMRYIYLNKQLLREIKMKRDEIVGYKMKDKFPGIEDSDIYQKIKTCLKDGQTSTVTNEFRFPDGRHTYHELIIEAIDEGVIIFSRDITKTRKGVQLLQETNKQLELFVHMAAHDMREPIRRLSTLSEELLLDHSDDMSAQAKSITSDIQKQTSNLDQLLNNLRALSGIGATAMRREMIVLSDLVKSYMREISASLTQAPTIRYPENEQAIACYPTLVKLLLRNLIDNAIVHGFGELAFSINVENNGSTPIYCIANKTHQTTPANDIFLPFVKGEQSSGKGLGLTVSKKIINLHQGKIWPEFKDKEFSIYFTLAG